MLGKIIALFIFPMIIYFTIYPMITQEVYNAVNCNSNYTGNGTIQELFNQQQQAPPGETNSFGGAGGNYHYGGYDGEVTHKDFVSSHAVYQTNSSFFNPTCEQLTDSEKQLLSNLPLIFLISTALVGWFWYRNLFYSSCWGGVD